MHRCVYSVYVYVYDYMYIICIYLSVNVYVKKICYTYIWEMKIGK